MIAWMIEALLASALLMALVLLVRVPVRRAFGPGVAYALWLLPLLRLVLPPLPAGWREAAATPISQAGETITILVIEPAGVAAAPVASVDPSLSWGLGLLLLWSAGAAVFLLWHGVRHLAFCRRLLAGAASLGRRGSVEVVASDAATGPLAFGIVRRYVAFPPDFASRYDADERDLALAHELGHHARGDLIANWAALVVLALHWFNPIAWRAFRLFRVDQELANDARVLAGRSAVDRHAYACAIVKAAHGGALSAACHLHTVDDLKGRLKMLTTSRVSRRRIAAGAGAIGTILLAGLGLTASGTEAAERIKTATGIDLVQAEAASPTPAAPVASPAATSAVVAPAAPAAPVRKRQRRVVVVKDGERTVYEGADADAYVAANPLPEPPTPPAPPAWSDRAAPPLPPLPPLPPQRVRVIVRDATGAIRSRDFGPTVRPSDIPQVESMVCPGDAARPLVLNQRDGTRRRVIICTNRIDAEAAKAAAGAAAARATQVDAEARRRAALGSALAHLQATRASMLANRDMADWERREAARSIDDSIRQLQGEIAHGS